MSIKELIERIHSRVTADDESESEGQGYLSTRAEWHSAAWGFSTAFLAIFLMQLWILMAAIGWIFTRAADDEVPDYIPYPEQFVKESLYVVAHAIAGIFAGGGARLLFEFLQLL